MMRLGYLCREKVRICGNFGFRSLFLYDMYNKINKQNIQHIDVPVMEERYHCFE